MLDRVDAVGAVGRLGPAGPGDADLVIDDVVRPLGLDPVALGVLDGEVAQGDPVGGDEQPLARALLAGEVEHRRLHSRAAHGDVVDIEREPVGQREAARREHDLVARLGEDQRLLQAFLRALAGGDVMRFGENGRGGGKRKCGNRQSDHMSLSPATYSAAWREDCKVVGGESGSSVTPRLRGSPSPFVLSLSKHRSCFECSAQSEERPFDKLRANGFGGWGGRAETREGLECLNPAP